MKIGIVMGIQSPGWAPGTGNTPRGILNVGQPQILRGGWHTKVFLMSQQKNNPRTEVWHTVTFWNWSWLHNGAWEGTVSLWDSPASVASAPCGALPNPERQGSHFVLRKFQVWNSQRLSQVKHPLEPRDYETNPAQGLKTAITRNCDQWTFMKKYIW